MPIKREDWHFLTCDVLLDSTWISVVTRVANESGSVWNHIGTRTRTVNPRMVPVPEPEPSRNLESSSETGSDWRMGFRSQNRFRFED